MHNNLANHKLIHLRQQLKEAQSMTSDAMRLVCYLMQTYVKQSQLSIDQADANATVRDMALEMDSESVPGQVIITVLTRAELEQRLLDESNGENHAD